MITEIQGASEYNLSRNPNYVKLQTDNYSYTANIGDKAIGVFTGLAIANTGQTMSVVFGLGTRTYTFGPVPNISILVLSEYPGGSVNAYIQTITAELKTDPGLIAYYNVKQRGSTIILTSLLPGPTFTLTGSASTVGAFFDDKWGTDNIQTLVRENFKIVTDIYQETIANSGVYKLVLSSSKEPLNNVVEMDLSPIIDNCLSYQFPAFYLDTQPPFFCPQLSKRFYCRHYERYGTPPSVPGIIIQNIPYHSLKAGFGVLLNRIISKNQYANFYFANQSFLTKQPRTKKISRDQNEFLYFLFANNYTGNATVKYTCYKTDHSIIINYAGSTSAGIKLGNVWAFHVNGPQGYFSQDTEIYKMDVEIAVPSISAIVSEKFTFYADDSHYPEKQYFYFANSEGGMDTIRMTGKRDDDISFERITTKRTRTINDSNYDGDTVSLYNERTKVCTAYSGFMDKKTFDYAEDFLLSKKTFIYKKGDFNTVEVPVVITSATRGSHKTDDNLYAFEIEYYEALTSEIPDYSNYSF